ncbi:MAG: metal-dependent transcriptional regulator [Candidatus Methanomethylicia archaeon]
MLSLNIKLTSKEFQYLMHIYNLSIDSQRAVYSDELAKIMGVKQSSSISILHRLKEKGLIVYEPRAGAYLTKIGRNIAENIIHRHRILEKFLVDYLKMAPKEACKESINIQLNFSEQTIEKLCFLLSKPGVCPCGKPIPHPHE